MPRLVFSCVCFCFVFFFFIVIFVTSFVLAVMVNRHPVVWLTIPSLGGVRVAALGYNHAIN